MRVAARLSRPVRTRGEQGMSEAQRMKLSRWRDPRLAGGILLLAVSAVVGGSLLRGPAMVPVYRAAGTIMPGTTLSEANVTLAEIPESVAGTYVGPGKGRSEATISTVVAEGELVSSDSLIDRESEGNVLVVPLMNGVPQALSQGQTAQVWRIRQEQPGGVPSVAELIADDVLVVSVSGPEMMLDQASAEIRVRDEQLASILAVLGSQDGMVLVEGGPR